MHSSRMRTTRSQCDAIQVIQDSRCIARMDDYTADMMGGRTGGIVRTNLVVVSRHRET